ILPVTETGEGSNFLQMGRNKLGLTLNPMKPEGAEIVKKLVATADVVVANLPAETLAAMGLDYESLKSVKPDIILTTSSTFGSVGPYSHRVGFDTIGQAMSGAMYLTGDEAEPMKAWVPYVDFGTALFSAVGTLAALMERRETGKGQMVEASLLGTALAFNNATIIEQAVIGADRTATGNRGQSTAPADAFQTKDGWIFVLAMGPPLFKRWTDLMGEDHWHDDPRFRDDQSRGDNGAVISERMAEWCRERTSEEALAALDEARLPAGPVLTPAEALADPHVQARGYFKMLDYPGLPRPAPISDTPVTLSETPGGIRHRAPTLGEHTDQILGELGYGADQIAELRDKRVV
ncbi:MAG: CoA transferase, partial [Alphaproteobacteria bacterium]